MPIAKVHFEKMIQDSQEYGSTDEHMVSRVFATIEAEGRIYRGITIDVKQTVGSNFETAPLEVSHPHGYDGGLDYAAFRALVEQYYRSLVGSAGRGIHIEGASFVRMRNNTFVVPRTLQFEYSPQSPAW